MIDCPNILGIGELLWDCFPHGNHLGGAPGNLLMHASVLGADAHLISAVGDDQLGREAIALLQSRGVNCDAVARQKETPTGRVDITLNSDGSANYVFAKKIPWDALHWEDKFAEIAAQADLVCFGTLAQRTALSHETTLKILSHCRPNSWRLFDANFRPESYSKEVVLASLQAANALKLNEEELPEIVAMLGLSSSSNENLIVQIADAYDLHLVALTLGSKGTLVIFDGEMVHSNAPPTKVIDTVGAGDSFTAALLVGLNEGAPLQELCNLANQIAAYVCSQPGAVPELPTELLDTWKTLLNDAQPTA